MCSGISGGKKQGGSLSSELMLDPDSQKHYNNDVCCKKETRLSKDILRASYQENMMLFFLNITVRVYLPPQNKTRETQCFLRVGQEQQHLNKQHTQRSSDHRTGNKMHQAEEIPLGGESWCMASREIQRKLCADSDWLL